LRSVEKGGFGYIRSRRAKQFLFGLLCLIPIVLLLVIGVLVYGSRMNYFTVPAAVIVIPMANFIVVGISLLGMDYGTMEQYKELTAFDNAGMLLSDLIFVDEKGRRIPCAFAVVYSGGIVAYAGWEHGRKYRKEQAEIPVNDLLKRKDYPARMKMYTDWNEFKKRIGSLPAPTEEADVRRVSMLKEAVLSLCL
jgi:hypothetical protein